MSVRILCVDDEVRILRALRRQLAGSFAIEVAEGAQAGLAMIREGGGPFGVVVSDMRMPGMDGVRFLQEVRRCSPDSVRIMLTGLTDLETAVEAVNEGNIFRFLTKPCPTERMARALEAGLEQYQLIRAEKDLLEKTLNGCISVLAEILSMTDPDAFGHASAVRDAVREVAPHLAIEQPWEVESAALLASLGHVTIPPELAARATAGEELSDAERAMLARVPEIGASLIGSIPRLEGVSAIVRYQDDHSANDEERSIPPGARLLKALNDLIEIESSRGLARMEALAELRAREGYYDPAVLAAIAASLGSCEESSARAAEIRPREVYFDDLRPGQVLVSAIETVEGNCLLREGRELTSVILHRLRNYQEISAIREPIAVLERGTPAGPIVTAGSAAE